VQLDTLVASELDYGHSNARSHGKAALLKELTDGTSGFNAIDLSDQTVTVVGDAGIVRHAMRAKTINSGVQGEVHISVLQVWQQKDGAWKLIARQAVKVP
jgi:ketosteroid isomerase-like protein